MQEAEAGNFVFARQLESASPALAHSEQAEKVLALAAAEAGDIALANRLVDKFEREYPSDTIVQHYILPAVRASIQLQLGYPARAVEILSPALKYDLASAPPLSSLYPAYIRGQAYLQLGQGHLAAVEFQKLLDHPGMIGRDVVGALARLQMARARKLETADPDLPIYQQAKIEYARLPGNEMEVTPVN